MIIFQEKVSRKVLGSNQIKWKFSRIYSDKLIMFLSSKSPGNLVKYIQIK